MKVTTILTLLSLVFICDISASEIRLVNEEGIVLDTKYLNDEKEEVYNFNVMSYQDAVVISFSKQGNSYSSGAIEMVQYLSRYNTSETEEVSINPVFNYKGVEYTPPEIVRSGRISFALVVNQLTAPFGLVSVLSISLFGDGDTLYRYWIMWTPEGNIEAITRLK